MSEDLLMVIPPVMIKKNGLLEVDTDFANNLRAYLENFDHVTIAAPLAIPGHQDGIPATLPLEEVPGHQRAKIVELPLPWREDRYLRNRLGVSKLLRSLISAADYPSFSPYGPLDWASLGANLARRMGRSYNVEADWDIQNVVAALLAEMPAGPQKIRRHLLLRWFMRQHFKALRGSSAALLMGQDVYNAYKDIAPNPHKVFNVQVTSKDRLTEAQLAKKLRHIQAGEPLIISYAGRAHEMKGPFDWLETVNNLAKSGVAIRATWFGAGPLLERLRMKKTELGLSDDMVAFPGKVERAVAMATIRRSDIFLVCHKTPESPRNLIEALAGATPLVSYESSYARDLVSQCGGGEFVPMNDWRALAECLRALNADRLRLAQLVKNAHSTAKTLDREKAIRHRIELIKTHIVRSSSSD
jgi:glycosyltransferase involved in cell wall biosynthesis